MDQCESAARALALGNLLAAYEAASAAIAAHGENARARYLQALALARMGETGQAQALHDAHLAASSAAADLDTRALAARLAKDRAFDAPVADAPALLATASEAYAAILADGADPFPAVNAATLAAMAGNRAHAEALARETLRLLGDAPPQDYFAAATAAEAHLVLGNEPEADRWLARALALPGADLGARSSTTRQFARLTESLGIGAALLERLRPPPVAMFCGHMFAGSEAAVEGLREAIAAQLDALDIRIGFGALACGADIVIAEELLARGGELNVVLPFAEEDFLRLSVASGGEDWVERCRACLDAAAEVEIASPTQVMEQDRQLAHASALAMGYARLRADHLETAAVQLAVWDGSAPDAGEIAGTAADVARWQRCGGVTVTIPLDRARHPAPEHAVRKAAPVAPQQLRAMVFADFAGFSKLAEGEFPAFWQQVLGRAAAVIARHGDKVCSRNSWGDAVFVVAEDAATAARIALELQDAMGGENSAGFGAGAGMRVGAHLGAVLEAVDPVTQGTTFFGRAVNMTARIEPVASTGEIYVTRQFGAMLALENPGEFELSYVGRMQLAKNFGEAVLYRLDREAGRI